MRNNKVDEARVRRIARRRGLVLRKVRRIDRGAADYGSWSLFDPVTRTSGTAPSLLGVEAMLTLDSVLVAEALKMPPPEPILAALVPPPPKADGERRPARPPAVVAAEAVERMRSIGLEPLCEFPGWSYAWPCRCVREGCLVTPSYQNVVSGNTRSCRRCNPRGRISASRAVAEAAEYGFSPQSPYASLGASWSLLHVTCGQVVELSLRGLRQGVQCPSCP